MAFFVSPHGLGHAARAAAIMATLREQRPGCGFSVFTRVPQAFFTGSVPGPITCHEVDTDVGVVQDSPLHADAGRTAAALDRFLPFAPRTVAALAQQVRDDGCALVVCDISPLGLAVARAAGVPSVLVENFTWDWIYEAYHHPGLDRHIPLLRELFHSADALIQTEPVSLRRRADLVTAPVSRKLREPAAAVRARLGLRAADRAVLVTMGGIPLDYTFLHALAAHAPVQFVVPGRLPPAALPPNVHRLAPDSGVYHPDLVNACDAVVGKLGYSTVAEIRQAGVPYGFVDRPCFREAAVLAAYVRARLPCLEFDAPEFESGRWLDRLDALLALPRAAPAPDNGADAAAAFLLSRLAGPA